MKPVPGYPNLSADDTGSIWLNQDGTLARLDSWKNADGYVVVQVPGRRDPLYAHRLTLMAWAGPPPAPGMVTRHKDNDRSNNAPANLRWGTPKDNAQDRVKSGVRFCGESNPAAKLTAREAFAARVLREFGISRKEVAARFKVSPYTVKSIEEGRTWKEPTP